MGDAGGGAEGRGAATCGGGERVDRLAVTGTPGTGKTAATESLAGRFDVEVRHLNELVRERGLRKARDEERDTVVADLDAVRAALGAWSGVVESHLAHRLEADRAVVLRCRPDVLETRLLERGEPPATAAENRESEALDVILAEAVDRFGRGRIHEIDTTDRTPAETAAELWAVLCGEREPEVGTVDYLAYARTDDPR